MAIGDSGQNIDISIKVVDKWSKGLKDAGKGLKQLGDETDKLSDKTDKNNKKMNKSLDFFENNSNKALKKTAKSLANFGGAFGNIAEDFSLGAGIMIGAVGLLTKTIVNEMKKQDEAFINLSKTVNDSGRIIVGSMKNIVDESKKISEATNRIAQLQNDINAIGGSERGGLGLFDRLRGFSSIEDKEDVIKKDKASLLAIEELRKSGKVKGVFPSISNEEFQNLKQKKLAEVEATQKANSPEGRKAKAESSTKEFRDIESKIAEIRKNGIKDVKEYVSLLEKDDELRKSISAGSPYLLSAMEEQIRREETLAEKKKQMEPLTQDEILKAQQIAQLKTQINNIDAKSTEGIIAKAQAEIALQQASEGARSQVIALAQELSKFGGGFGSVRSGGGGILNRGAQATSSNAEVVYDKDYVSKSGKKGAYLVDTNLAGNNGPLNVGTYGLGTQTTKSKKKAPRPGSHFEDASMFITSKGDVMTFSPQDNISLNASKQGGNMGGGVTIIVQGSVVTWEEVMDKVETSIGRKLKNKVSIGTT
mgnify:CR=1 FL=1